jgi:hypothetical protein
MPGFHSFTLAGLDMCAVFCMRTGFAFWNWVWLRASRVDGWYLTRPAVVLLRACAQLRTPLPRASAVLRLELFAFLLKAWRL